VVSKVEEALYKQSKRITSIDPGNGEEILEKGDPLGHSYWLENPWVNFDVMIALSSCLAPYGRGLVRKEGRVAWISG
jgi:hypothetical protein